MADVAADERRYQHCRAHAGGRHVARSFSLQRQFPQWHRQSTAAIRRHSIRDVIASWRHDDAKKCVRLIVRRSVRALHCHYYTTDVRLSVNEMNQLPPSFPPSLAASLARYYWMLQRAPAGRLASPTHINYTTVCRCVDNGDLLLLLLLLTSC